MNQIKTKGIIISDTNYGETSKILNVLTQDKGIIGIISKGCRNITKKRINKINLWIFLPKLQRKQPINTNRSRRFK